MIWGLICLSCFRIDWIISKGKQDVWSKFCSHVHKTKSRLKLLTSMDLIPFYTQQKSSTVPVTMMPTIIQYLKTNAKPKEGKSLRNLNSDLSFSIYLHEISSRTLTQKYLMKILVPGLKGHGCSKFVPEKTLAVYLHGT